MSKIISAVDARNIRQKYEEDKIEHQFASLMKKIAYIAAYDNFLELKDYWCNGDVTVRECEHVTFLQDNPQQVQRLINMGYKVEQEVDDSITGTYEKRKYTTYPRYYFWKTDSYVTTTETVALTIRKFIISWEEEEPNDK